MKKAYICPITIMVKVATQSMIAFSNGNQSLSNASEYSGGGTLSGSRRGSDWDDEDYDD